LESSFSFTPVMAAAGEEDGEMQQSIEATVDRVSSMPDEIFAAFSHW
jgi:hypothetical protein